ncbi:MAG: S41 family peptidase [Pirellulaceae bacterium]
MFQLTNPFKVSMFVNCLFRMRVLSAFLSGVTLLAIFSFPLLGQSSEVVESERAAVFDEVVRIVKEHFYDQDYDWEAWQSSVVAARENAFAAKSPDAFAVAVNDLLASLQTSHTQYFSKSDPRRYQLVGVFAALYEDRDDDFFCYDGIGIDSRVIEGKTYVTAVFDGFPAAKAGLRFGDQILAVNNEPLQLIRSFAGLSGQQVLVKILRQGKKLVIHCGVERIDGRTMFETALKSSVRIIERGGRKIGYVHVWCYAGMKYQELLRTELLYGQLSNCDALVLDLRDGWGGANLNYLNLFREPLAIVKATDRAGKQSSFSDVWGKPVALLTNVGSTSGKELFTYGFKKWKLGKVFGEKTAGAVVAGRAFVLSNDDFLYLAVMDVEIDGKRLEGRGVKPDVRVERDLLQSDRNDPQLGAAVEYLVKEAAGSE